MCSGPRRAPAVRSPFVSQATGLLAAALCGGTIGVRAETGIAVEYYYAAWDQYFVTAFPDEVALLDAGAFGGVWHRTGETFPVATQAAGSFVDTCRFFSVSFAPKSAHFYTPSAAECSQVKANPDWQFESVAFYLAGADSNGSCPSDTSPLYRLYNNGAGGAPNHRYTASHATFDRMAAQGWIPEGNGPNVVFACVPGFPATLAAGIYTGISSANETIVAIVMPDGGYFIVHSVPNDSTYRGVINGTASTAAGRFISSDAYDYSGGAAKPVGVDGSYTPAVELQITLRATIADSSETFTAAFVTGSDQAPSLDAAAGMYSGTFGHVGGRRNTRFSIDAAGHLAGATDARSGETPCSFAGTLAPRSSINVFELTLASTGGECIFGAPGDAISGIAYYDSTSQRLRAFAPFFGRSDMLYLIGSE